MELVATRPAALFLLIKLGLLLSTVHRKGKNLMSDLYPIQLANSILMSMYLSTSLSTYLFISVSVSPFFSPIHAYDDFEFSTLLCSLITSFHHENLSRSPGVPTLKKVLMLFYLYEFFLHA